MPRDVCAISEELAPACLTAYAYDGSGGFLQEHEFQQRGQAKQVAINVGRYISSDPIGLAGGLNTFDYAWQNPVNWIDPWGLWPSILGVELFPETKQQVLENGPGLILQLAPSVTPEEAKSLVGHVVDECNKTDVVNALGAGEIKSVNDLTNAQKKLIEEFIKRLSAADQKIIEKIMKDINYKPYVPEPEPKKKPKMNE